MGIGNSELGRLSADEVKILKNSWEGIMRNAGDNGAYIFGRFLKKYNYFSYFKRFSEASADSIDDNVAFKDHSFLIMSTIDKIILHSTNDEELKKDLYKLGKLHTRKNLGQQQFLELKSIIIDIMDKKFRLPVETLKIWNKAFDISYFYVFQVLDTNGSTSTTSPEM